MPYFYEQREPGSWKRLVRDEPEQHERWLDAVYSDTTLVTALVDMDLPASMGPFSVAVSSSTAPGLMARMLEGLDLHDGHAVLEIGTGTGYNAALLSERLGDGRVFSVDLRPDLVEAAAARLARAGYHPTLAADDGVDGLATHGPYDRIIATCGVQHIPPAWIEQLRPAGMMLVDVQGPITGNLAALHRRDGDVVEGRFCSPWGSFLPMQHQLDVAPGRSYLRDTSHIAERTTALDPHVVHQLNRPFALFVQLHLPPGAQLQLAGAADDAVTRLVTPDGSWCEVGQRPDDSGRHRVLEGGPQHLWRTVERAWQRYAALGRPAWERFGITASPTRQYVWLDRPDSDVILSVSIDGSP